MVFRPKSSIIGRKEGALDERSSMRSFDYSKLIEKAWNTDILNLVAKIHECKGRQDLFIRQKPVELDRLVEIAKIQSTEASNKIEGIVTTSTRMKQLFEEKTTPRNRDEDEIMGYRDVLNTIHESNEYIPIRSSYILQLHRDLLKRAGLSYGGHFKNVQNYINETKADGTVVTRFTPIAPYDTPEAVENLCNAYEQAIANEKITLEEADAGWHEEENDPTSFIRYMLQVILSCYTEFEERVGLMNESSGNSTAYDIVKKYTEEKIGKFTGADVVAHCPSIGRSSALAALKKLTEEGLIIRQGSGRSTFYVRADSK